MKRDDIVICVTNELYGQKQSLDIGEKYIVVDIIEMSEKKIVQVCDMNKKEFGLYDDKHFITLNVWREFQLRKLLD
jgi:hypothetical protein